MRRKAVLSLTVICLILGMVGVAAGGEVPAPTRASLKAVMLAGPPSGGEVLLRIEGDYSYRTVQATDSAVWVDLQGAQAGDLPKTGHWTGGLVDGYRVLQYTDANGQSVVRVQLDASHGGPVTAKRDAEGLHIFFAPVSPGLSRSVATVAPTAPAPAKPTEAPSEPAPQAAPAGPGTVLGVTIVTGKAGETLVDIETSHKLPYTVFQLDDPPRLVVDFEGAERATDKKIYEAESAVLKGVRVGQFRESNPAVVRVVADLIGKPRYDVHAVAGGVRVELKGKGSENQVKAPQPAATPPAKPQEEKRIERVAVDQGKETAAEPAEQTPAPKPEKAPSVVTTTTTQTVAATPTSIDLQNTLPAAAGSQEVAAAPKKSETNEDSPEALQAARAAMTLVGRSGVFSAAPQGQGGVAEEAPAQYTGEPISLNLKDVDLKDFFRLIHEISGLNIIVDPNVTGNVTLVLDAVPWDQALDIVLKNNRLGRTLEGNVLRIARMETLTAEQEATVKLAAAREEAQPLVTVFRPVNYAKASTIATMLKSWVGGGALSKRGNILVDERANTLIISDIQTQIPIIESIITRLDKKAKQVQIEARIVLATSAFSRDLATALSAAYANPAGTTTTAAGTGDGSMGSASGNVGFSPSVEVNTPSVGGFGVFAISNAGARYAINAAIAAAETHSQAKTLSRPSIVTQNNVPGTVQQGTQIPIQTTINNTISIQYVNATLTLRVTPQVTEDGYIFLDINVTNARPGLVLTGAGPSIDTQQATTQVLVPDGGTVVFGGVTVSARRKNSSRVPLLGSIPIIGNLFKSSGVSDSEQELLFFVSPKVLPG
ncbi:MAG TPA: type IV pilus secretin PilQ [Terriglobia bacterium]|nr:type IV pilus secretin PilQ [Terriglobia bacterium]